MATRVTKSRILSLFCIICVLLVSKAGLADTVRFITIDVAPWAWADSATGEKHGVFPDVMREIERRTGHSIDMSLQPFVRINRELESGARDCTIVVWIDSNESFLVPGELVSQHPMGILARAGVPLKNYDDLKSMTISVLRGAPTDARFDADTTLRKDFDNDYDQILRKIEHNRVDAIAGAMPTIRYLATQRGIKLGDEIQLGQFPLVLQCAKSSPKLPLMPELNKAIRDMRDDGTLDKILKDNYFS
jgi:polar amino acid transport system substrate-binding protein